MNMNLYTPVMPSWMTVGFWNPPPFDPMTVLIIFAMLAVSFATAAATLVAALAKGG
jgi:hypothetical protein